ncbi:MAG: ABC transporter substrate-binding protein [Oligoflexia bacterium]|nr:ABC transporter substrate-binding protein [Oligoflexia bacterium]
MSQEIKKSVTIVLQGNLPDRPLVPEDISTIPLYHLHFNLWDTLIGEKGSAAIANGVTVNKENTIYNFEISNNAKFSNGRIITADDVKKSLERLIEREENGHINGKSTIKDIRVKNVNQLEIELHKATPSFLFMLSTPEFGIVPKENLDEKGNIINLDVTSGAYFLKKVDVVSQEVVLEKNPYYLRFRENSPAHVTLLFRKSDSIEEFQENLQKSNADFIEVQSSDADAFFPYAESLGYSSAITMPSMSVFLSASNNLPLEVKEVVAATFQKHFQYKNTTNSERLSKQLLPPKTFGSLSQDEIPKISFKENILLPKEIKIRSSRKSGALIDAIKNTFKILDIEVRLVDGNEPFDYWFLSQGMNTESPEIELYLQAVGPYAIYKAPEKLKSLISESSHETNDKNRSDKIKQACKDLLSSGQIIPLTVRSYIHFFKKNKINTERVNGYDGTIPIYEIEVME